MPTLARWFIRTSFVCLGLALLAGVLLALQSVLGASLIEELFPLYIHLLALGWLTQLVFGVAYWMFPVFSVDRPRRSDALGWWTYGLLNLGLLLRIIAEPLLQFQSGGPAGIALVLSAGMQFCAGLFFVVNTWPRVRMR